VRARVLIRPKAGILDPQGVAVERRAAGRSVSPAVGNVHIGRLIELDVEDPEQLQPMCEKLLANPLVEGLRDRVRRSRCLDMRMVHVSMC